MNYGWRPFASSRFRRGCASVFVVAGCVALAGCRQSRVRELAWPFARGTTVGDDLRLRRSPALTPAELAAANREKGTTYGLSDRARAIEQRLGME